MHDCEYSMVYVFNMYFILRTAVYYCNRKRNFLNGKKLKESGDFPDVLFFHRARSPPFSNLQFFDGIILDGETWKEKLSSATTALAGVIQLYILSSFVTAPFSLRNCAWKSGKFGKNTSKNLLCTYYCSFLVFEGKLLEWKKMLLEPPPAFGILR